AIAKRTAPSRRRGRKPVPVGRPPGEHPATAFGERGVVRREAAGRELETSLGGLESPAELAIRRRELFARPTQKVFDVGGKAQPEDHLAPRVCGVLEAPQHLIAILRAQALAQMIEDPAKAR